MEKENEVRDLDLTDTDDGDSSESEQLEQAGVSSDDDTEASDNGQSTETDTDIYRLTEAVYAEDLSLIKQAFPQETAEDIHALGEDFFKLMHAGRDIGLSPVAAYAATHTEKIVQSREKELKQRALNELSSKMHLKNVSGASATRGEVPQGIFEKYKTLIPNATESEIRKHYFSSRDD